MTASSHPKRRGQRSEAAVRDELLKRGIPVLEPFGDDERYDLVVDIDGTFLRVQVKTGRLVDSGVHFETGSPGTHTRSVEKEPDAGDVEAFFVHAPRIERTFAVPVGAAPESSMCLRVRPPNKDSPNSNRASDYGIDGWLDSVRSA